MQVGRQQVEDLRVLGEDGQERVPPSGRLAAQETRCIVGVGGDVLMALGGREDELRVTGDELVRITPPERRAGGGQTGGGIASPHFRRASISPAASADERAASFRHPSLCTPQ